MSRHEKPGSNLNFKRLYPMLIESTRPAIQVNGRQLPGNPVERVQADIKTTTAFLYFSETWIRPGRQVDSIRLAVFTVSPHRS